MSTRRLCVAFSLLVPLAAASAQAPRRAAPEMRCGWFDNPTPANAWLTDRDGEWLISMQGGYQATGDWPAFDDSKGTQWVYENVGSYGYGCACMRVVTDPRRRRIVEILSASAKPLRACRRDPALPRR